MSYITQKDVVARINAFCDDYELYADAARALKCTPAQLSQARAGKLSTIPASILKKLALTPITLYVSKDKKPMKIEKSKAARKPAAKPRVGTVDGYTAVIRGRAMPPPAKGETPALKPAESILSRDETEFDDIDSINLEYEQPGLTINAFGED